MKSSKASSLLRAGAPVAVTAVLGSLATTGIKSPWYQRLDKPGIQPPGWVFPLVWTALYTSIAISSARVFASAPDDRRAKDFERRLWVNLALNTSWSWVFFRAHQLPAAIAVAATLSASSADLVRHSRHIDAKAAAALAPNSLWCAFATVLTTAIWRRNR